MSSPDRVAETAARSWFRRLWLPVAVLVAVTALDLGTGRDTVFYPFLVLAPALAAATAPPVGVLLIGVVALPLRFLLAHYDESIEPYDDPFFQVNTSVFVTAIAAAAILAKVRMSRERRLAAVTEIATAAQRAILLPPPETVGGVRLAVRYFAVADGADVGGDLYEAVETPYGVRVLIGDVLGKGLPAVRTAAITLGAFREAAYDEPELAAVARRIDRSLARHTSGEVFVTALFAEVRRDRVALLHRGHEQPMLVRGDGRITVLEPPDPGLPLGLGELDTGTPPPWTPLFREGDLLLLVTDGVADARDAAGRPYPLLRRVVELLGGGRLGRPDPAVAVGRVGDDLRRHVGRLRLTDDALLLALARVPGG